MESREAHYYWTIFVVLPLYTAAVYFKTTKM